MVISAFGMNYGLRGDAAALIYGPHRQNFLRMILIMVSDTEGEMAPDGSGSDFRV